MFYFKRRITVVKNFQNALQWVKDNTIPEQGIVVSTKQKYPYPEVTGYFIPTLINSGELNLAEQYADFLSYTQLPNGSFFGPDGKEHIFDTGQALRGFLAASKYWDRFKPNAIKAANYLISSIKSNGQISFKTEQKDIPEFVHIYILPPLLEAANTCNDLKCLEAVKKSILYYKGIADIGKFNCLSHFFGYIVDGFIDVGETDFIQPAVEKIFSLQRRNGGIPAFSGTNWICSTATAQFAVCGFKLGMLKEASRAVHYLCKVQNRSGGFYGSYGFGRKYFPHEEISWANKFFLDAVLLKVESFFNRQASIFPSKVLADDGRLKTIFKHFGDCSNKKILDAGCGKGRFALAIKERYPSSCVEGVDISDELLKAIPASIITKKGNIINLPYDSETFDAVLCVEALEHTIVFEKAIEELCRVLKNQGKIIIIDKNIKKLGRLKITDFEQWFNKSKVKTILKKYCNDVVVKEIAYDKHKADGLFFAWIGTKRESILDCRQWNEVTAGRRSYKCTADIIRCNQFPLWCKPLLKYTSDKDSMLELGSGTGELSAILSIYGRFCHLLDYSEETIRYSKKLFGELNIKGKFYCEDILNELSIKENSIDWVWSSGLLEHFSNEQIISILKKSKKICKKGVMSLVPNANSLFYRIGKFKMEREGSWLYGREKPAFSLRGLFENAGLKNVKEYSLGTYHALNFWGLKSKAIKDFIKTQSLEELCKLNQGYLIFTYGEE